MFGLSAAVRVYLAKEPADMRKSFDGLAALASGALGLDPLSGHLFVFVNKRRDRIKILYWDRDGLAVWAKKYQSEAIRQCSVIVRSCVFRRSALHTNDGATPDA
jgi:transposase